MSTSRAERAAVTRRKLLDAATQLFLDQPYDEVSVHDLAETAGVAYGLVAHHFGNKRGIHREAMRQIARGFAQGPPPPGPAGARVRQFVGDHLASVRQNPAAYLGLVLGADADSRAIVESARELAVEALGEILGLDPHRPAARLALRSWLGAVLEATITWLRDQRPFPAAELVELLTAALAGLLGQAVRLDPGLGPVPALNPAPASENLGG